MLRSAAICLSRPRQVPATAATYVHRGFASDTPSPQEKAQAKDDATKAEGTAAADGTKEPKHKKTMAELDEELKQKMSGLSGDGGESGVEYEDGQPVAMKRSVKSNMFRYI
ncbi:hypothetical protein BJ170DRAFT_258616 [Xylariales sp. AK1849]|nr:hypothetical protein BJ170DRAFT_258616 [Xylariales sp. AK1849]